MAAVLSTMTCTLVGILPPIQKMDIDQSVYQSKMLAPHPVYFSIDGRKSQTETDDYFVYWDGKTKMYIKEKGGLDKFMDRLAKIIMGKNKMFLWIALGVAALFFWKAIMIITPFLLLNTVDPGDHDNPERLIIKINKTTYLIYSNGKIVIRKIIDGAQGLFDKFYKIKKPDIEPRDDNHWPNHPHRWKWKP